LRTVPTEHAAATSSIDAFRARVDGVLMSFLAERRHEIQSLDPDAVVLIDEISRLTFAGGKRLRPAFCYWGYRVVGAPDDDRIVRAAAAMELLHTMALIHDDLVDGAEERRGVPSSRRFLTDRMRALGPGVDDPDHGGSSLALLAGDLAAVLADRLFLASGFPPDRLMGALDRYGAMRTEMAAGQALDLMAVSRDDPERAARVATLRGGRYTVDGPLAVGAILAGASRPVLDALAAFAGPLGAAFQLADDLRDGEDRSGRSHRDVAQLRTRAVAALDGASLDADAAAALRDLADMVAPS
jgi:geranylgeranyl diphosphate synthase type I